MTRSSGGRNTRHRFLGAWLWPIACSLLLPGGCGGRTENGDHGEASHGAVVLLAAASTAEAVDEIRRRFEEETGVKVTVSPGGSNTLASQIIAGAPADLFLSANQQWVGAVEDKQLVAKSQHLLTNRLVLVVPKGNPDQVGSPDDLKSPKLRKLALAGAKVPAGMYADQALRSLKLLDDLVRGQKIARGHDVRVALTYVELGEASAGIVYATDACASPKVDIIYTFPKEAHEEIAYPLVLLKQGAENPAARRFFEYLSGEAATAVFERYGFERLKVPSN